MKTKKLWDNHRNNITSNVGAWRGGIDVYFQKYSMTRDIFGKVSYMQVIILNATGKLVERNVADWLEGNFIGLSYPDSRIWCNQVAAFSATMGATVSAAAATSILAADSRAYGGSQTSITGMTFLYQALKKYQVGTSWTEILKDVVTRNGKPMINGFARPVDKDDERIQPYEELRKKLAIPLGKHLSFAFELSDFLCSQYGLSINSGGYVNALLLDQGFSPEDVSKIKAFAVVSGAIASYRDNEKGCFLPLHCEDINYQGPAPRPIP